ncbi:calcium-binding protein, partial [Myroides odoratimimus]|nr:calcium-binding protein [Myroides odoratimimus]
DVLDVVTHSFDKVIEKNTDKITEVIRETEGNVRVVDVAGKPVLQYKPKGSDDYVNVDLAGVETVTKIDKQVAQETALNSGVYEFKLTPNVTAPAAGKGVIYYAYQGEKDAEGNSVTTYIDLGKDVETLLKENTTIKETFEKEIQKVLDGDGGNVYYGKINGGTEDVLYEKKEVAGKPG